MQRGVGEECGRCLIGRLEERRRIRGEAFSVERLVPTIEGLQRTRDSQIGDARNRAGVTYHIICDKLQVTHVHVDLIHSEDATDLAQNSGARSLNAVCTQQSIDVVRVYVILVDDGFAAAASELP